MRPVLRARLVYHYVRSPPTAAVAGAPGCEPPDPTRSGPTAGARLVEIGRKGDGPRWLSCSAVADVALAIRRVGLWLDSGYLVLSPIIERDCKPPSTSAEITMLLQSMNPLRNILIIHEGSEIIFLQNVKPASVAAFYRAG